MRIAEIISHGIFMLGQKLKLIKNIFFFIGEREGRELKVLTMKNNSAIWNVHINSHLMWLNLLVTQAPLALSLRHRDDSFHNVYAFLNINRLLKSSRPLVFHL